ncbi:conserved hypothetical protein, partial [Trichinella spiralis]|uniref:hypothetical protein n=1 Tax=Trichinella spiralis TaxID=6334 RepID=UPI0001EFDE45
MGASNQGARVKMCIQINQHFHPATFPCQRVQPTQTMGIVCTPIAYIMLTLCSNSSFGSIFNLLKQAFNVACAMSDIYANRG